MCCYNSCCVSQVGKLSTGDSLDMSPHDEAAIIANDATVKDMEVQLSYSVLTLLVNANCTKRKKIVLVADDHIISYLKLFNTTAIDIKH